MSKKYTTVQGDSFDAIAYRLWRADHMCSALIAANPDHADTVIFEAGVELVVPDIQPAPSTGRLPAWYGGGHE